MDQALTDLQDEVKILKNEIKDTLVGIRDYLLTNIENPFPTETRREMPAVEHAPAPTAPTPVPAPVQASAPPPAPTPYSTITVGASAPPIANGAPGAMYPTSIPTGPMSALPEAVAPAQPQQPVSASVPPTVHEAPDTTYPASISSESLSSLPEAQPRPEERMERPTGNAPVEHHVFEADRQEPSHQAPSRASEAPTPREPSPATESAGADVTDLLTVATLASWIEEGVARVGKERLQALIDIYVAMGGVSSQMHEIITKLITLDGNQEPTETVTLKECMRLLVDLDGLLWRSRTNNVNAALLNSLVGRSANPPSLKSLGKGSGNLASLLAL